MSANASLLCAHFLRVLRPRLLVLLGAAALALGFTFATPAPASASTTLMWTNRGPADGFDTIYGAQADEARAVVDAALDAWERTLPALNRRSTPGNDTIAITVNANPAAPGSCGGSASGNFDADGYPVGGAVNINGLANMWFVDPTPTEHSEFTGGIANGFAGDAQAGSPAAGLCDLYTLVVAEANHILGITSNAAARYQTGDHHRQLTTTGTTCSGPGNFYRFTGDTHTHLMTSNNGGGDGSDFGVPVHSAEPCGSSDGLAGADDAGNALFEGSRRYLVPNSMAMIMRDAYQFGLVMPERFGTFYTVMNSTTGELLVRGSDDAADSADTITITRDGGTITASVDVGNDVVATGPADAFISDFNAGQVRSIRIEGDNGADIVTVGAGIGVPVTVNADDGNDTVTIADGVDARTTVNGGAGDDQLRGAGAIVGGAGDDTLVGTVGHDSLQGEGGADTIDGLAGNDTIRGGSGDDRLDAGTGSNDVTDGDGSDVVNLSQNAVAVNYTSGGGGDTITTTPFNDQLSGAHGDDQLIGGGGNDTIAGAGGHDRLVGEEGVDLLRGDGGDDTILGGDGSDSITWDADDGSDTVEGGAGESDRLGVFGSSDADFFSVAPTVGSSFEVTRSNFDPFALGANSIEDVFVEPRDGEDAVTAGDLSSTEIRKITLRGFENNAAVDSFSVEGTSGADTIEASSSAARTLNVSGLGYAVAMENVDWNDVATLQGGAGRDTTIANLNDGTHLYRPTGPTSASVSILNASLTLTGMEEAVLDAHGGGDNLVVASPTGANDVAVTPGSTVGTGSVRISGQLPATYRGFEGGNLTLNEATRSDRLTYGGSDAGDTFTASGAQPIVLNGHMPLHATSVRELVLDGRAGDDRFNLSALPYDATTTDGGALNTDVVSLSGAAGAAVVDYASSAVTGFGGTVTLAGIERTTTAQTGAATATLTVRGTAAPDDVSYQPAGAQAGAVSLGAAHPVLSFSGVAGMFTVDPAEDVDRLTVNGTTANDVFTVSTGATTTTKVNGTKPVRVPQASTESIDMNASEGTDQFDVTVFNDVAPALAVYGDRPAAKRFSDSLTVRDGSGKAQFSDVKGHVFETGSAIATYRSTNRTVRVDYIDVESIKFVR